MDESDRAEMNREQIIRMLRGEEKPGMLPLVGVVCNPHVAHLLKEELREARKRWRRPVELLIDPGKPSQQSEVYRSRAAWLERCEKQRRARSTQRRLLKWLPDDRVE